MGKGRVVGTLRLQIESMGHTYKMLQFEDWNQTENCYTRKITMSVCLYFWNNI